MEELTNIKELKSRIQVKTDTHMPIQVLTYIGKILHDVFMLFDYCIGKDSILFLSAQLCRGGIGEGNPSSSKPNFKYKLKHKWRATPHVIHPPEAYTVEKMEKSPMIEETDPFIQNLHNAYFANALICIFNGF